MTAAQWNQSHPAPARVGYMPPGAEDYREYQTQGEAVTLEVDGGAWVRLPIGLVPVEHLVVLGEYKNAK